MQIQSKLILVVKDISCGQIIRNQLKIIISISLQLFPWINVMLYFICMDFGELLGTGNKRKIKIKMYVFPEMAPATLAFQRSAYDRLATMIDVMFSFKSPEESWHMN